MRKADASALGRFFTPRAVFWLALLSVTAANATHLVSPPYWDGIVGVYSQGTWLARNGFNLVALMSEPTYVEGGPYLNPFLAWSMLFAVLTYALPPFVVLAVLHALTLGLAALTLAICFALLAARAGHWLALLWTAAAAANPVFSGQAAGIYLEIPVAAFFAISLVHFDRGQFMAAAAICAVGWFMKNSMLITAAAYAAFALIAILFGGAIGTRAHAAQSPRTLTLAAPLPLMLLASLAVPPSLNLGQDLAIRAERLAHQAWSCFPDLFALSLFGVFAAGAWLYRGTRSIAGQSQEHAKQQARDRSMVLLLSTLLGGFWVSFLLYDNPLARYTTLVVVPLVLLLAIITASRPRLSASLGGFLLLFGLVNQAGVLLPELPYYASRSGHFLERSREYLADHDANREMARLLESRHGDAVIVAKYPFVQMLRLPELGYVHRALPNVMAAGAAPRITDARLFRGFDTLPSDALIVFAPNVFESTLPPSLQPRPLDKIVYTFAGGTNPTVVYRRAGLP